MTYGSCPAIKCREMFPAISPAVDESGRDVKPVEIGISSLRGGCGGAGDKANLRTNPAVAGSHERFADGRELLVIEAVSELAHRAAADGDAQ